MLGFFEYVAQNSDTILSLFIEHISLTLMAVSIAICIGVPIGILVSYVKAARKPILGFANVMQAVPSMALLGFIIPVLGIGPKPGIFMVVVYSLLPIIKNTFTGLESVNPQTLEAAKGIGMTRMQILSKVQIPSALPIIMAGIRISAVTSVGLMTTAAFVGAGGLGYLVFSGIRTVNNYQILAGAIPACLLALFMDFLLSTVEKIVTPVGMRKDLNSLNVKHTIKKVQLQKRILAVTVVAVAIFFGTSAAYANMNKVEGITIGSKDYTEQQLVALMAAEMIEAHTDIPVYRNLALGGTQIVFSAIENGEIDMYIDYTGTLFGSILNHDPVSDAQFVFDVTKEDLADQYDLVLLDDLGFNNTYTLAVTPEVAEEYNLTTLSDLSRVSNQLVLGANMEFLNREDGMIGLKETYNFTFKDEIALESSLRYIAVDDGEADVINSFATDGLLESFGLVVLEDDKNFFLPYYAAPVIRQETLDQYPEIEPLMIQLGEVLDDDVMRRLNAEVDDKHRVPDEVAREFLQEEGLIP